MEIIGPNSVEFSYGTTLDGIDANIMDTGYHPTYISNL
jgi:hypothetical protein